jgi:hypothetical protein
MANKGADLQQAFAGEFLTRRTAEMNNLTNIAEAAWLLFKVTS